jgi:hypothetical protein
VHSPSQTAWQVVNEEWSDGALVGSKPHAGSDVVRTRTADQMIRLSWQWICHSSFVVTRQITVQRSNQLSQTIENELLNGELEVNRPLPHKLVSQSLFFNAFTGYKTIAGLT